LEDQTILFSVIIPTHNRAALLRQAIQSVIDQTVQDWELIVVNDGSTDETKTTVSSFPDQRIKYIFQQNQKLSAARNTGVLHAKGKYICFLDDDDYYLNDHLFNFYTWLSKNDYPVVILRSAFSYKTQKGIINGPYYEEQLHRNSVNFAAFYFCGSVTLCIPKVCFKEDLFISGTEPWEDTHFMLRVFTKYPFHQLPFFTYIYVKHSIMGSIKIYTAQDTLKMVGQNINAMRDLFKNYKHLVKDFLPAYTLKYIVSEKYSQHAINSVLFGKYRLGWHFFILAIKEDKGIYQWRNYLKFLVLLPLKFFFNYPKIKMADQ
jgi:glycosyltransferase involved in cell wall biosynthesis